MCVNKTNNKRKSHGAVISDGSLKDLVILSTFVNAKTDLRQTGEGKRE